MISSKEAVQARRSPLTPEEVHGPPKPLFEVNIRLISELLQLVNRGKGVQNVSLARGIIFGLQVGADYLSKEVQHLV